MYTVTVYGLIHSSVAVVGLMMPDNLNLKIVQRLSSSYGQYVH